MVMVVIDFAELNVLMGVPAEDANQSAAASAADLFSTMVSLPR